jgi:hypothetical protein
MDLKEIDINHDYVIALSGNPDKIMIPRCLLDIVEDYKATAILSQLIYWTPRSKDPGKWIYKSNKDWYKELKIKRKAVETAVFKLTKLDLVETKVKTANGAPTTHYRINGVVLTELLNLIKENANKELKDSIDVKTGQMESAEMVQSNVSIQDNGKSKNDTKECVGTIHSSITENTTKTTNREYGQRVQGTPPAGHTSLLEDKSEGEVSDSKREYADELTSQIDKVLPDKYRIGRLPKKYVSKLLVLNTVIEPDTIEEYIRWYLDVKEPTKGCALGLLLFKEMGLEYKAVSAEYKKTKKGKKTTTNWADKPADSTGAIERFRKFQEKMKNENVT